jgi:ketosteroid isomerase-like protein
MMRWPPTTITTRGQRPREPRMTDPERPIIALIDGYRAAILAKDVAAFMALYDPQVRIFDTWALAPYDAAGWRAMAEGWFSSLGGETVAVRVEDVRTCLGLDLMLISARVTYAGMSAAGQELRSMQNRLSWVLRPADGALRIVHEHTSVPVDMRTGKGILGETAPD